jgi:hypothetical protein
MNLDRKIFSFQIKKTAAADVLVCPRSIIYINEEKKIDIRLKLIYYSRTSSAKQHAQTCHHQTTHWL